MAVRALVGQVKYCITVRYRYRNSDLHTYAQGHWLNSTDYSLPCASPSWYLIQAFAATEHTFTFDAVNSLRITSK